MSRLVACLVGTLAVLGLWLWIGSSPEPRKGVHLRYALEEGTELRYTLSLESDAELDSAVGARTAVSLAGELRIEVVGARGDSFELVLSIAELERASIRVNGAERDASSIARATAALEMDASGRISSVRMGQHTTAEASGVLRAIIGQLQLRLEDGAAWTGIEQTVLGAVRYGAVVAATGDGATVYRGRSAYSSLRQLERIADGKALEQSLDHSSWFRLERGSITSLNSRETLLVRAGGKMLLRSESTLALRLHKSARATRSKRVALGSPGPLDAFAITPEMANNHLRDLAGNITRDEIIKTATFIGEVGPLPGHRRRFAAALAFLRLHPEAMADVSAVFTMANATVHSRAFVLDLLASTNTRASQRALIGLLDSEPARSDAAYHEYVARLGQVMQPSMELASAARRIYEREARQPNEHTAATFALGTVAGRLEEPSARRELAAILIGDLRTSDGDETTATLLRALGNAGLVETGELIAKKSSSESTRVRRAAASALRRIHTPKAAATLIGLAADDAPSVQRAALRALDQHTLSAEKLADLAEADVASENGYFLLSVMRRHQSDAAIAVVAKRMLGRSDLSASLRRELTRRARN